jgi:hypothetical protein
VLEVRVQLLKAQQLRVLQLLVQQRVLLRPLLCAPHRWQ